MKDFRIAIIGLGEVAKVHLESFKLLDNLEIIAVCDTQQCVANLTGKNLGAEAFTNYRDLLANCHPDLVIVLTPASTHCEIVIAIAEAGFHVFCEKPMAVTLEDGEAMVSACKHANVSLFYGSCFRYLPAIRTAHDLIRQGMIGDIQLMTEQVIGGNGLEKYKELSPIHYPAGGPGGSGMGLVDHGIHLIDIFSWFANSDVMQVQGRGQRSSAFPITEYLDMEFKNGAVGHLIYNTATFSSELPNEGIFSDGQGWLGDGSIAEPGLWVQNPGSISVYGTKGTLRIFHYANALFLNTGSGHQKIDLEGRPAFGHFATQLEDCISAITENRPPSIRGEDGVRVLKSMLDVYPSLPR